MNEIANLNVSIKRNISMRIPSALEKMQKIGFLTVALLALCAGNAKAQTVFNQLDWLVDRGNRNFFGPNTAPNALAQRQGNGNYTPRGNNPGPAVPIWVWPSTRDLTNYGDTTLPTNVIIDNPIDPSAGNAFRTNPVSNTTVTPNVYPNPGQSLFTGGWIVPLPANRAPGGGYSLGNDPTDATNFDYAYLMALHNDFGVLRNNGTRTPATLQELAQLPNATPDVYRAVDDVLQNAAFPKAQWTSGQLFGPGRYAIELHSPGDGTLIGGSPAPNVTRALVRISWNNTVSGAGTAQTINQAGINNVINSRIFLVDLSRPGWIRLEGGGLGPAAFPFDGSIPNQITVTLYAVTPDRIDSPIFVNPPVVTADAVRFVPIRLETHNLRVANGEYIAASGRMLASAVGTEKIGAGVKPFTYIAREESLQDTVVRSFLNPRNGTSHRIADPTSQTNVPVFYCIDGTRGNVIDTDPLNPSGFTSSASKVVWRYIPVGSKVRITDKDIYSILANGSNIRDLTPNSVNSDETSSNQPRRWAVYSNNASGTYQIYMTNAFGKSTLRLTTNTANDTLPNIAPNGRKIAFLSDRDGNPEIYVMSADGSSPVNVSNSTATDGGFVWSPDNSKLAFVSNRDGNNEVYVVDADGTNLTRLTNDAGNDIQPIWSPDGTKLAWVHDQDTGMAHVWTIKTMDADGNNQVTLLTGPDDAAISQIAWAPNNTKLAYVQQVTGKGDIFTVNIDGTGAANISNNAADETTPVWSPASSRIAFVSDRDGIRKVYISTITGTTQRKLINDAVEDSAPHWYFDSSRLLLTRTAEGVNSVAQVDTAGTNLIALTANATDNINAQWANLRSVAYVSNATANLEIYTMTSAGNTKTRITTNAAADRQPSWSPDGMKIAFTSARTGRDQLYTMNFDGTGVTRITTNNFSDSQPSWSPDGTKIAFVSNRDGNPELYVMNPDGSGTARLTTIATSDIQPVWSPDGKKIAFVSNRGGNNDVYTINPDGTGLVRITNSLADDVDPAWSPEGTRIAFTTNRNGTYQIFLMDTDGGNLVRLTSDFAGDSEPAWSADALSLTFTRQNFVRDPLQGSASPLASALLGNVRCRDGNTRTMVYFTISSGDGGSGRVFALDANGVVGTQQTFAYWAYPSVRPLLNPGVVEPVNAPAEYQDPNFRLGTGVAARTGYPSPTTWSADGPASQNGAVYFDGDIITNPINPTQMVVRQDTQLPQFGGVFGAPILQDDPSNPAGPHVLIVPNMNGRLYTFDAGGRGDFIGDGSVAGTTQRLWTWPHVSADAFRHLAAAAQALTNNLADEPAKVAFPSSPTVTTGDGTIVVGASDGHVYDIGTQRDTLTLPIINNNPVWQNRLAWLYPSANSTLGAPVSAIAYSTFGTNTNLFFTSGGRVYSIDSTTPVGSAPALQTLKWVYPPTPNPPNPADPATDPTGATLALDPGFSGNAPLVQETTLVDNSLKTICYGLQSNGTLFALDAVNGAFLAKGQSIFRNAAHASPISALITPMDRYRTPEVPTGDREVIVFADDSGVIQAMSAAPIAIDGGTPVLPVLWGWFDSRHPRTAGSALVGLDVPAGRKGGTLLEGDEGGQLRAYGFGDGSSGTTPTTGPGEPIGTLPGDGTVAIDIRVVDIYDAPSYRRLGLIPVDADYPNRLTPGLTTSGKFARTIDPLSGNLGSGSSYAFEWGDFIYVAAWGVYKSTTLNSEQATHATQLPTIEVDFTISGQNVNTGANETLRAQVPAHIRIPANGTHADDAGVSDAEADNLSIFGIDANNMMDPGPKVLTGTTNNVYPWVAVLRVPRNGYLIQPRQNLSLVPGTVSITAYAQIRQNVTNSSITQESTDITQTMLVGQRDLVGKSTSFRQLTPEQINNRTPERRLYIAHPLGVSVRGSLAFSNQLRESAIGYSAVPTAEVLANGNRMVQDISSGAALIKSLFAPVGMIPPGTSKSYAALTDANVSTPGLFAVDRSNLAINTGRRLSITASSRSIRWAGSANSVMNPLPWEIMPNVTADSPDYPHITPEAISLKNVNGQSLLDTSNGDSPALESPIYPDPSNTLNRTLRETTLDLTVSVPRYQPASVNYGATVFEGRNFGFGYRDISGRLRGGNALTDPIIGPLLNSTGLSAAAGNVNSFPAAGYISDLVLRAATSGQNLRGLSSAPYFEDTRNGQVAGAVSPTQAYRAIEFGLSVPPSYKMRIAETTVDFGKQPHGTGYSDLTGSGFRAPFAPSRSKIYAGASPWDAFFRPLTIYNESNVNIIRPRLAKMVGIEGSTIGPLSLTNNPPAGIAAASRLSSDQVDFLSNQSIFGIGFAGAGTGNIGFISSLDHVSTNDGNFRTLPLWPVNNPYVVSDGIANAGLPTADDLLNGILGWTAGVQPHPTIHKPRVGDSTGPFMTVPDAPYGATEANNPDLRPMVGVAVPLGTPSGTFSNPVYAFEDYTPFQWRAWLFAARGSALTGPGANYDGILTVNRSSAPLEPFTETAVNLKVTVMESQLTQGITPGSLRQIDNSATDILGGNRVGFQGLNIQPSAIRLPSANPAEEGIVLFWATNRDTGVSGRPFNLAYSFLRTPLSDNTFFRSGTGSNTDAFWWASPTLFKGNKDSSMLFPSTLGEAQAAAIGGVNPPYLSGVRATSTERHESPASVVAVNPTNAYDRDAVVFWPGSIDKVSGGSSATQVKDSRIFYSFLTNGVPGDAASLLNDPALSKLSPRPLYLKLPATNASPAQQMVFLFWYAGRSGQTGLYYNVNIANGSGQFLQNNWSRDLKLPTPGALVWQSDPYPVYRRVNDGNNGLVDVIDVMYTGVLKNRQNVEVLMTRYFINRTKGQLEVNTLPAVVQETAARTGAGNTYTTRDAGWQATDANNNGLVVIEMLKNNLNAPIPLNNRADGTLQRGRFDAASGLLYFDSALGGQIVVDTLSGAITFPNVPPGRNDALLVTYIPQVMRLNASRDDSNVVRNAGTNSPLPVSDPTVGPKPGVTGVGNHYAPIGIMDRMPNPRIAYTAPGVLFNANGTRITSGTAPSVDRFWVLYRKSDPQGVVRSTIYYKALRLQVRLPRPIGLTNPDADGNQQILNLRVVGNRGPYEVDWVRGRIYFTEVDEGSLITVTYRAPLNYQAVRSNLTLQYRVSWGDEVTTGSQEFADPDFPTNEGMRFSVYQTTPEVVMPSSVSVNEGQVTAFKDPLYDKLWVFWSSSRGRSTDLFYQTLSPNLYPAAPNQR